MTVIKFEPPRGRRIEAELLEKLHLAIDEYVGELTMCQVIGVLDFCKREVFEDSEE